MTSLFSKRVIHCCSIDDKKNCICSFLSRFTVIFNKTANKAKASMKALQGP